MLKLKILFKKAKEVPLVRDIEICIVTMLRHFLNINQSHAFPERIAFTLGTSMHFFFQVRCDTG